MSYAEGTTVPFEKSIAEIITVIKKAGAGQIGRFEDASFFAIQFALADRSVRFRVPFKPLSEMPTHDGRGAKLTDAQRQAKFEASRRQRGRALLLVIKAKLESVESGVETFEEAFLAHIVLDGGKTVYERIREPIALEYASGRPNPTVALLGGPSA
ncbi:hypothetical protein [Novosphingobium sp.]|uniref:hypothetical protein n=1 Tax=Novosphingobium sp. TaxID=1874826 RepID=UPI00352B2564